MEKSQTPPDWRLYERFVASLESEKATNEITVIPNAKLIGCISHVERQVDVLIDARLQEDTTRRIIVDAKLWRRKINVKDVESFEGMMRDCRANKGILVCPNGYSPAALRRSQDYITIRLVTLAELESIDPSRWDHCVGQCQKYFATKNPGWVLYDQTIAIQTPFNLISIVSIGKCDECHDFNIWCWDCGEKFALVGNEAEYKCECDRFWLTSVEDEGIDHMNNELSAVVLIVVLLHPQRWKVLDRRPLN